LSALAVEGKESQRFPTIEELETEFNSETNDHVRKLINLAIGALELDDGFRAEAFLAKVQGIREAETAIPEDLRLEDFGWLLDLSKKLDRKFEVTDFKQDTRLQIAATWYLRTGYAQYKRDSFPFMDQMVEQDRLGGLSSAQLKGVANCFVARLKYAERENIRKEWEKSHQQQALSEKEKFGDLTTEIKPVVPSGYYTVVFGRELEGPFEPNPDPESHAKYVTIRLTPMRHTNPSRPRPKGAQIASFLFGPNNSSDYRAFATVIGDKIDPWAGTDLRGVHVQALEILLKGGLDTARKAGQAYALQSNCCYNCGRRLTVPFSVHLGLGPVCSSYGRGEIN
jgi:Family of unknown function (DUF6011)